MASHLMTRSSSRHWLLFGCIGLLPLVVTSLAFWLLPTLPVLMRPDPAHQLLWLPVGLLLGLLRQRATQLAGVVLIALSAFGQMHAMAAFVHYGVHYRTDLHIANLIFAGMAALHLLGMLLCERLIGVDHRHDPAPHVTREAPGSVFMFLVLVFPFVWLVDMVASVGRIPLLTGAGLVNEMYQLNYGRLHGYALLIGVAAFLAAERLRAAQSRAARLPWLGLILVFALIAISDGRRVFLMVFLLALALSELRYRDWAAIRARFGGIALAIALVYVGVEAWRQGYRHSQRDPMIFLMMSTGVEYRDFAFALQNLNNNALAHFDLLKSAVGGFGNWFMLAIFGINKNEYVGAGSAYQLAIALRSAFGIRIGLFAELYLGYAWWGGLVGLVLGAVYAWLAHRLALARTEVGAALLCFVMAAFLLGYVGQASATAGYLSVLFYLWLLWRLLTAMGRSYARYSMPAMPMGLARRGRR